MIEQNILFKNEKISLLGISKKDTTKEKGYDYGVIPVSFKKGEIEKLKNKDLLKINDYFYTFYKNKNNHTVIKIVILDYQVIDNLE